MRSETDMMAYALEAEPELLPLLPELLQDFQALGGDVRAIVEAVGGLALPANFRVVDLGCGKGAVSVALAKAFRCRVLGIDLFEPFIDACRDYARLNGVERACEFRRGNIVALADEVEPADIAVFAALGDVLGPRDETMGILRRNVKPGGHIAIGDGFLRRVEASAFPGFEGAALRDAALEGWTAMGDVLVSEHVTNDDAVYDEEARLIARRAEALMLVHPALADRIRGFVQSQTEEYEFLRREFVSATWVFRRT